MASEKAWPMKYWPMLIVWWFYLFRRSWRIDYRRLWPPPEAVEVGRAWHWPAIQLLVKRIHCSWYLLFWLTIHRRWLTWRYSDQRLVGAMTLFWLFSIDARWRYLCDIDAEEEGCHDIHECSILGIIFCWYWNIRPVFDEGGDRVDFGGCWSPFLTDAIHRPATMFQPFWLKEEFPWSTGWCHSDGVCWRDRPTDLGYSEISDSAVFNGIPLLQCWWSPSVTLLTLLLKRNQYSAINEDMTWSTDGIRWGGHSGRWLTVEWWHSRLIGNGRYCLDPEGGSDHSKKPTSCICCSIGDRFLSTVNIRWKWWHSIHSISAWWYSGGTAPSGKKGG